MKLFGNEYMRAFKNLHAQSKDDQYELRKQLWIEEHPDSSPEEYTRAMRAIANELGI